MSINSGNQATNFTLPPGGQLIMPFAIEAAVASLPVFCASAAQGLVLDNLIEFLTDGNYQMIVRSAPSTQQQSPSNVVLGNQTFEDQISVPAGSFLTMIGGITTVAGGFRFQLTDDGAQEIIGGGYVNSNCMTGRFTQLPQTGTGMLTSLVGSKNLFILPSPLSITSPGQLRVQITNLSSSTATIDMAFYFATPIHGFTPAKQAIAGNSVLR